MESAQQPEDVQPDDRSFAQRAYEAEPAFDQDEGLSDADKEVADSFPASDPPAAP